MKHTISRHDNVIDGRDVEKRIDELKGELYDFEHAVEKAQERLADVDTDDADAVEEAEAELDDAREELAEWTDENDQELKELVDFRESVNSSEWPNVTLIHEDHFEDYARQFAEDIGAISRDTRWPATCIDWEQAARELRMDYSAAEFAGETFYFN
jgi:septal ring factor EnvC (AmiA/AmiB activator)